MAKKEPMQIGDSVELNGMKGTVEGFSMNETPPVPFVYWEDGTSSYFNPPTKRKPRKPKPIPLPDEVWVMAYNTATMLGSVSHVSYGDKFFRTREACQQAIDNMKGWIGMGDRSQYRPLLLVKGEE